MTITTARPGRSGPGRAPATGGHPSRRRPGHPDRGAGASQDLLADAARGLDDAIRETDVAGRYAAAHLAGLRAAAALVAVRAQPVRGRRPARSGNVWDLLERFEPDLADWSAFFRAGVGKRQLAEAGIGRTIGEREADDLVRQTGQFLELVEQRLRRRHGGTGGSAAHR